MAVEELGGKETSQVFRPCGRAFFVYYVAMALCFFGPLINPEVGLPPWLGLLLGLLLVAAVVYHRWGQEYHVTAAGVKKIWRWPDRQQEIPWDRLGEVLVRRGFTQTMLRVGNLVMTDKSGGPDMFWFGLADPKSVQTLIHQRRG
ncbi:MAG: hypothetical protein AB1491_13170 [Thermodesulfobacteriota bacterium]